MRDARLRGDQDEQDRAYIVAGSVAGHFRQVGAPDYWTGTGHHWLLPAHTDGERHRTRREHIRVDDGPDSDEQHVGPSGSGLAQTGQRTTAARRSTVRRRYRKIDQTDTSIIIVSLHRL